MLDHKQRFSRLLWSLILSGEGLREGSLEDCSVAVANRAKCKRVAGLQLFGYNNHYCLCCERWRGTQNEKGRVCKALFDGSIPSRAST
jgi:cation transport regulator ChaC